MRALPAVVAIALAACGPGDECRDNGEGACGGDLVCARNAECLPTDEVRVVRVTWTIRGQPASEATCAASPTFYLLFYGADPGDTFGFSPVPCELGLFTIDRMPLRFVGAEIGEDNGFSMSRSFDAQGRVAFDLAP